MRRRKDGAEGGDADERVGNSSGRNAQLRGRRLNEPANEAAVARTSTEVN